MVDIPKKELLLLNNIPNYISLPQASLDARSIDEYDKSRIVQMMHLVIGRIKHFSEGLMTRKIEAGFADIDFVKMMNYPLFATFNIKTNKPIVNLTPFGKKEATNIESRSLYSAIFYSYVCKYYTLRPIKENIYQYVSSYLANIFREVFGKKYGVMSSYYDILPKLQFICTSYVLVSFYGKDQKSTYSAASKAGLSYKDFPTDMNQYNLYSIRDFIKLLSDSEVFPGMDYMEFAEAIIKRFGIIMLPFFEDGMRFMALLATSGMPTGGLIPPYLEKYQMSMYSKIVSTIENVIK